MGNKIVFRVVLSVLAVGLVACQPQQPETPQSLVRLNVTVLEAEGSSSSVPVSMGNGFSISVPFYDCDYTLAPDGTGAVQISPDRRFTYHEDARCRLEVGDSAWAEVGTYANGNEKVQSLTERS